MSLTTAAAFTYSIATTGVVAFTGLTLVLNAITPSAEERNIWVPVILVLLASSLTVALTAGQPAAH